MSDTRPVVFPPVAVPNQPPPGQQPAPVPFLADTPERDFEAATRWAFSGEASVEELRRLERSSRNTKQRFDYFQVQMGIAKMPRIAETQRRIHQELLPLIFANLNTLKPETRVALLALLAKMQENDLAYIQRLATEGPQDLPTLVPEPEKHEDVTTAAKAFLSLTPRERDSVRRSLSTVLRAARSLPASPDG